MVLFALILGVLIGALAVANNDDFRKKVLDGQNFVINKIQGGSKEKSEDDSDEDGEK